MRQGTINPQAQAVLRQIGDPMDEVWSNDTYEVQVRYLGLNRNGMLHLSIKTFTREVVRDWRHLQSIKNEVAGPHREAIELFPDESRLVDAANQTHLWVMAAGVWVPVGYKERAVQTQEGSTAEMARRGIPDNGKGRQRPWQPGLFTGPGHE